MAADKKSYPPVPPGHILVFRPWITRKDGSRLYAWQCGLRAFPLIVPAK